MTPAEASDSIAERFTRVMNATPSPLGVLSDFITASVVSGAVIVGGLFGVRNSHDVTSLYVVLLFAALPLAACWAISLTMGGARAKVVAWLTSLPFAVDNLNTLLAGSGDTLEVIFREGAALPVRTGLQPELDAISEDVLFVKARPEERAVEIRLGIIDSKRIPLKSNHDRWKRMVAVVERVLVPLARTAPIERIRVV